MDDQRSLEEQLLGDMSYDDPRKYAQPAGADPRLANATVPVLDDMGGGAAPPPVKPRYQQLTDEQIAVLQQQRAEKGQPPYTAEEIAELKAEFIERQRMQMQQQAMAQEAAQQSAAAASVLLEEATYTAPEKKKTVELPQADASVLLEEPAPEPERRVSFNQEDLEAAKKAAAKRAVESLNNAPPASETDQKEARRQIEALHQMQLADKAQEGFKVSILATVIGIIAGACMAIFASGKYPEDFEPGAFFNIAGTFYQIGGIVLALLAITIVLRVRALKGFTSMLGGLSSVLLLIPGVIVLFQKRGAAGFGLTAAAYVIAIVGCFAVTFVMSSSENLGAYYERRDIMID